MAVDGNSDVEKGDRSPSSVVQIKFKCNACPKTRCLGIIRCALLVVYSFVGAGIFMTVEGGRHENNSKANMAEIRGELLLTIFSNGSASNMSTVEAILLKYDSAVIETYIVGSKNEWDFWKSLFFATTVFTTIGYGNKVPETKLGRGITMLYSAIGIPLFLLVMGDVGGYLKSLLYRKLQKYWCCRTHGNKCLGDTKHKPKTVVITLVAALIMITYLFIGTFIYTRWEAWTFFDTFYFLFISFTTIGFGDIVPAHPKFFLVSSPFYILIGLSTMAMCIDLVKDSMNELSQPREHPSNAFLTKEQSQLLEQSSTTQETCIQADDKRKKK
ncbi:hypothetical protein CHS0354_041287 [Potamilus streckersoni]|uniref:Potassium channel domain-containing protein n=1 Tax=Potamilus streckersoni TaxID=2493646 RepID=A0AAE0SEH3_9BIVA|nr:hypothetical protein CHS0354_041287 [Potamilus streckersoni]